MKPVALSAQASNFRGTDGDRGLSCGPSGRRREVDLKADYGSADVPARDNTGQA